MKNTRRMLRTSPDDLPGNKRESVTVENKSAITVHADWNSCTTDWEGAKVIDRESNRNARWIRGHMDQKDDSNHESRREGY